MYDTSFRAYSYGLVKLRKSSDQITIQYVTGFYRKILWKHFCKYGIIHRLTAVEPDIEYA